MATMGTSLRNGYDNGLGYEYANSNGLSHSNSDPGPSQHETNGPGFNGTYVNYGGPSHQSGMPHSLPRHAQSHLVSTSHPPLPAQSHPAPLSAGFEHLTASGSIPSMSQPYINAHPSNPNLQQFTPFQPAPIPGPPYPGQHIQQHYVPGMPPVTVHAMPPPGYSFGQPPTSELWPNHADWDDERDYIDGQEVIYGQLEVKHRRRTTPEQLKVLEHWFDVNPKPDNNLREWLAVELGMTKRNIQVWFQNRRAKVKGLAQKEKAAAAKAAADVGKGESLRTPENASTTPPDNAPPVVTESQATPSPVTIDAPRPIPQRPAPLQLYSQPQVSQLDTQAGLLPPVNGVNMGRRASLANGEAAKIESFIAKQRMAARKAGGGVLRQPGFVSPVRSPAIGQYQASLARRTSIPYPSPLPEAGLSPKISPSVRPAPSALHLAAMRNNVRRSSMPGVAGQVQLISSGPFTPPRVASSNATGVIGQGNRELSPIKDSDGEHSSMAHGEHFYFQGASDMSAAFLAPPSSTYFPGHSPSTFLGTDASAGTFDFSPESMQYTPNGPLPNPGFSFGSAGPVPHLSVEEQNNMWLEMQGRGRLGSIASINTFTTEGATTADGSDYDWNSAGGMVEPEGFDPDTRRASAPADLLHNLNLGYMYGNAAPNTLNTPLRPSPLGAPGANPTGPYDMAQSLSNATTSTSGEGYMYPTIDYSTSNSDNSPVSDPSSRSSPTGIVAAQQPGKGQLHKPVHLALSMSSIHPQYADGQALPQSVEGSHKSSPYSGQSNGGFTLPSGIVGYEGANGNGVKVNGHQLSGDERAKTEEYSFFEGLAQDPINVLA